MNKLNLLLIVILLMIVTGLNAQSLKYSDVNTVGKSDGYTSYISKDGTLYKIGDTLKINKPASGNGLFIYIKTLFMMKSPANQRESGRLSIIKEINVITGNSQIWGNKSGYIVEIRGSGAGYTYIINFEDAIAVGEVRGLGLSSDEALTQLKKSKDKLDLGLITSEQYEKIKTDLAKFIK